MKQRLIIILIFGLVSIGILKVISKPFASSDNTIGRLSNLLNWNNTIEINCIGLDKQNIDLIWYPDMTDSILIIEQGRQVGKIGYEYGPNRFKILLSNDIEFSVGHNKSNDWHSYKYEINILKDSNGYKIGFTANGPDFKKYEQSFDLNGCYMED